MSRNALIIALVFSSFSSGTFLNSPGAFAKNAVSSASSIKATVVHGAILSGKAARETMSQCSRAVPQPDGW